MQKYLLQIRAEQEISILSKLLYNITYILIKFHFITIHLKGTGIQLKLVKSVQVKYPD